MTLQTDHSKLSMVHDGLCDVDSEGRLVFFEPGISKIEDIKDVLSVAEEASNPKQKATGVQTNRIRGLHTGLPRSTSGVHLRPLESEKLVRGLDSAQSFASRKAASTAARLWLRTPEHKETKLGPWQRSEKELIDEENELQLGVLKTLQTEWQESHETRLDLDLGEYLNVSEFALRRMHESVRLLQDPFRFSHPIVVGQQIDMAVESVSKDLEQWLMKLTTVISVYHVQLLDFMKGKKEEACRADDLERKLQESEDTKSSLRRELEVVKKELVLLRSRRRGGAMLGLTESEIMMGMEGVAELKDIDNMEAAMDKQSNDMTSLKYELEKARLALQKEQDARKHDRERAGIVGHERGGVVLRGLSDEALKLTSDIAWLAGARVADHDIELAAALQELSAEVLGTGNGLRGIFDGLGGSKLLVELRGDDPSSIQYDEMGNVLVSSGKAIGGLRDAQGNLVSKAAGKGVLYDRLHACLVAVALELDAVEKELRQFPDGVPMSKSVAWATDTLKVAQKSCQLAAQSPNESSLAAENLRWPSPPEQKPGALKQAFLLTQGGLDSTMDSSDAGGSRGRKKGEGHRGGRGHGGSRGAEGEVDASGRYLVEGSSFYGSSGSWDGSSISGADDDGTGPTGRRGPRGKHGGKNGGFVAGQRPASQGGQRRRPGDPLSTTMGGPGGVGAQEMSMEGAAVLQTLEEYLDRALGMDGLVGLFKQVEDIQLRDHLTAALHEWRRKFPKSQLELVCKFCRRVCKSPRDIAFCSPPMPPQEEDAKQSGLTLGGAFGGGTTGRPPVVSLAEGKDLLLSQLPWVKPGYKPPSTLQTLSISKSETSLQGAPKVKRMLM